MGNRNRRKVLTAYLHPTRQRQMDVHISCMMGFLILHNITIQADAMPQPLIKTASKLQVNSKSCG